jgi:uncharacterized membrane protein YkoI
MARTSKLATVVLLALAASALPASVLADVNMTLEELPAAVRETAKREVRDGTITDIERETERGAVVYEVEFIEQGKKYELDIAEDGTLLRRHRD